jgi:hypothetical protein
MDLSFEFRADVTEEFEDPVPFQPSSIGKLCNYKTYLVSPT